MRPALSQCFSGRSRELDRLQDILVKWGSAVITQNARVGKTQLMIALAERAERNEAVPGGVFWVTVRGGERKVIESLARLAEELERRELGREERRNPKLVVALLKKGLDERGGRSLLCLDNADDITDSGILKEVCGVAKPKRGNMWVVVTSRQGQPHKRSGMKSRQRLVLRPLNAEDSMVALSRRFKYTNCKDKEVRSRIEELERDDPEEYRALKELCADKVGCSLGGLPYILMETEASTGISKFAEYLNRFKNPIEEIEDIQSEPILLMKPPPLLGWRPPSLRMPISVFRWGALEYGVQKLSRKAYDVLYAIAMLGPGYVGEAMMDGILRAATADGGGSVDGLFRTVIMGELMLGTSLIWRKKGKEGNCTYNMGSDLREYILNPTVLGLHPKSRRSRIRLLVNVGYRRFRGVRNSQWRAIMSIRRLISTTSKLEQTLDARGAIHGYGRPHLDKASTLNNLGLEYERKGELDKALEKLEEGLEMARAMHGHGRPHPHLALLLNNLGRVYMKTGKLDKAMQKHIECLEMRQVMVGNGKSHPDIAISLRNIGEVHHLQENLNKAVEFLQQCLEMLHILHGPNSWHPDIIAIQASLAEVCKDVYANARKARFEAYAENYSGVPRIKGLYA